MSEILVGVDGSPSAEDALAFAQRLAGATGASLRLATIFPYSDMHTRASNEPFREALRGEAKAIVDRATAALGGDVAQDVVADVSPPHALHRIAEETHAALVVVGSTHRGAIGRVMPGSTGERLLHGSPCPVAIVPRGYKERDAEIRTIGVGYDGFDESEAALTSACELAHRIGARVRVIRVFDASRDATPALAGIDYSSIEREVEEIQREELARLVGALGADVEAEAVFATGRPRPDARRGGRGCRLARRRLSRLRAAASRAAGRRLARRRARGRASRDRASSQRRDGPGRAVRFGCRNERLLECGALREVRLPREALTEVALDVGDTTAVLECALPAVHDHARKVEALVVVHADQIVRIEKLLGALEGEEARLGDHDQPGCGREGVDRQETETRRQSMSTMSPTSTFWSWRRRMNSSAVVRRDSREASAVSAGASAKPRRFRPARHSERIAGLEHHVGYGRSLLDVDAEDLRSGGLRV
jgi:nucleotide-binding universal stress UspA family protein